MTASRLFNGNVTNPLTGSTFSIAKQNALYSSPYRPFLIVPLSPVFLLVHPSNCNVVDCAGKGVYTYRAINYTFYSKRSRDILQLIKPTYSHEPRITGASALQNVNCLWEPLTVFKVIEESVQMHVEAMVAGRALMMDRFLVLFSILFLCACASARIDDTRPSTLRYKWSEQYDITRPTFVMDGYLFDTPWKCIHSKRPAKSIKTFFFQIKNNAVYTSRTVYNKF